MRSLQAIIRCRMKTDCKNILAAERDILPLTGQDRAQRGRDGSGKSGKRLAIPGFIGVFPDRLKITENTDEHGENGGNSEKYNEIFKNSSRFR